MSIGLSRPSLFSVLVFDGFLWMSSYALVVHGNAHEFDHIFAGSGGGARDAASVQQRFNRNEAYKSPKQ
jgi:hypothetical protein